MRQRRTLLMTPGHDRSLAEKALRARPDVLWLDLEDGVPEAHKLAARDVVVDGFQSLDFGATERLIRINPLSTPFGQDDLRHIAAAQPDGIVLTKIASAAEVQLADTLLTESGSHTDHIRLWCMIETPSSMLRLEEIASASPRVAALLYGGGGLLRELQPVPCKPADLAGLDGLRFEHLYGRSRLVLYARALGLLAIDSSFSDVHDPDGTYRDALYTFQLGFDGKMVLSPRQIEPVHRAFQDGLSAEHERPF
jgi:citrate lyase subunit beta / citryl-CoA lyase